MFVCHRTAESSFIRRFQGCLFCLVFEVVLFASIPAKAMTYAIEGNVVGSTAHYAVQEEDNLYALARRFDIGIVDLLAANPGVDPWMPDVEDDLIIPSMHVLPPVERRGIVINLSEMRLYFFPDSTTVMTFPLGIGKEGWQTPVGHTSVIRKRKDPVWIPPPSIRQENPDLPALFPAGPDNPLGEYALDLGWNGYRIHGTNRPYGIGLRSSHGCIRLYPEDIATLFPLVKTGESVTVIDMSYKLGWKNEQLWLEVSPTQQQADIIADYEQPEATDIPGIHGAIEEMAQDMAIDWYSVDEAILARRGVPVVIAQMTKP